MFRNHTTTSTDHATRRTARTNSPGRRWTTRTGHQEADVLQTRTCPSTSGRMGEADRAVKDSQRADSTETPCRKKEGVYSTCTFYEQLLAVAAQQCPGQERSKVHKDLPQQGGHLLQGSLQLGGDAKEEMRQEKMKQTEDKEKVKGRIGENN